MTTPTLPSPVRANVAIAEALGLDVSRIPRDGVSIRLTAEGPKVDVTYRVYDSELSEFVQVLKRYRLVPEDR